MTYSGYRGEAKSADRKEGIRIDCISDDAGFRSLEPCWNNLLRESNSSAVFLTWEWLYTWFKHLRGDRRLYILRLSSGDQTIGLAPLVIRPRAMAKLMGILVVEFLGVRTAGADYLDLIIRRGYETRAIAALGRFAGETPLVLRLEQVRQDDSAALQWSFQLQSRGWHGFSASSDVCPYVRLHGQQWEAYLASLGSEHRYNIRRKLNKLARSFDVKFERVQSESERSEVLALLIRLHNARWKKRTGTFNTPALISFHEEFTRLTLARGWLRLYVLRLNGTPVATLYGLLYEGVFSFYQCGFDAAYAQYSVGTLTMALAIQAAIKDGAREYDLLHGDEQYKSHWANAVREIGYIIICPPGVRGTLYEGAAQFNRRLKKMARRILTKEMAEAIAVKIRA